MTKNPKEIGRHKTFMNLFPMNEELLKKIEEDMKENQYDDSQPIILATWEGQEEPVCIDGHTRLQAAINAGIDHVPVFSHELDTEDEALEKAILLQARRRSMTDAEIFSCMEALDRRMPRGGDRRSKDAKSKPKSCGNESSRSLSAKEVAEKLGISTRKLEQARTVMDHGDEETIEAVKNGTLSINKGYGDTQRKRKETGAASSTSQSEKPTGKQSKFKTVRINADQWEELNEMARMGLGEIDDMIYEALAQYLGWELDDSEEPSYEESTEDE
jgi:hypothetical protein